MMAIMPVRHDQARNGREAMSELTPNSDANPTIKAIGMTINNRGNGRPMPSAPQMVASAMGTKDGGTIKTTAKSFSNFPALLIACVSLPKDSTTAISVVAAKSPLNEN